jgi:hypothetical protein
MIRFLLFFVAASAGQLIAILISKTLFGSASFITYFYKPFASAGEGVARQLLHGAGPSGASAADVCAGVLGIGAYSLAAGIIATRFPRRTR